MASPAVKDVWENALYLYPSAQNHSFRRLDCMMKLSHAGYERGCCGTSSEPWGGRAPCADFEQSGLTRNAFREARGVALHTLD